MNVSNTVSSWQRRSSKHGASRTRVRSEIRTTHFFKYKFYLFRYFICWRQPRLEKRNALWRNITNHFALKAYMFYRTGSKASKRYFIVLLTGLAWDFKVTAKLKLWDSLFSRWYRARTVRHHQQTRLYTLVIPSGRRTNISVVFRCLTTALLYMTTRINLHPDRSAWAVGVTLAAIPLRRWVGVQALQFGVLQ